MNIVGILLAILLMLGCQAQDTSVEKQEEKEGVEEVAQEDKNPNVQKDEPITEDEPTPEEKAAWAAQDRAKAAAAEHEMTVEDIKKLDDYSAGLLLNCQLLKYAEDHGQQAAQQHAEEIVSGLVAAEYQNPKNSYERQIKRQFEKDGVEPIYAEEGHDTVQAQLIEEGYSCTWQEMMATGTSASAMARTAAAAAEAQMEEEWAASARARADEVQLSAEGECRIEEHAREQDFEPDLLKVNVSDYMKAEDTSEEKALTFFDVPHYASCS